MIKPTIESILNAASTLATPSDILKNSTTLRKHIKGWPPELYGIVASQNILRNKASQKFKLANQMLFTQKALEQSTSENLANAVSHAIGNKKTIVEICSGVGGNSIGLQNICNKLICIEPDYLLNQFHRHNLALYKLKCSIEYYEDIAENYQFENPDLIFIDPDRRQNNNCRLEIETFSPPLSFLQKIADNYPTIIKMSPLWNDPDIPPPFKSLYMSEKNELKQCLWYTDGAIKNTSTFIIHQNDKNFSDTELDLLSSNSSEKEHLLVANPAIIKSTNGKEKIEDLHLQRLGPNPRFYLGNMIHTKPFFEAYEILLRDTFSIKILKKIIRETKEFRFEFRGDKEPLVEAESLIKKANQLSGTTLTIFLFKSKWHKQIYLTRHID